MALPGRWNLLERAMSSNRRSNTCFRAKTVAMETQILLPNMISRNKMTCCQVVMVLKLTVLRPASVMAEVTRNRLST